MFHTTIILNFKSHASLFVWQSYFDFKFLTACEIIYLSKKNLYSYIYYIYNIKNTDCLAEIIEK